MSSAPNASWFAKRGARHPLSGHIRLNGDGLPARACDFGNDFVGRSICSTA